MVDHDEERIGHGANATGQAAEGASKAFDASNAGEPGPGRAESDEESAGVLATDPSGESPLGVGESLSDRGEDVAAAQGAHDSTEGHKAPSNRPHGSIADEPSSGGLGEE